MAKKTLNWEDDTLVAAVGAMDDATDRFLTATIGYHTPRAEAYAKREARWTDRSTNARNSLYAVSEFDRPTYRIIVGHGVPYGLWLEVRFSGRFAILEQTIRTEGVEVMKTIQAGYMAGLIGGL